MLKNKSLFLALIYALLFSAAVCTVFYGGHMKYITHVYFIGLLFMLPFVYAAVWFKRKEVHQGEVGGREAGKDGLLFVVLVTFFLVVFQVLFYEISFRDYKINYIQTAGPQILKEQIAAGKMKITEAEIPKIIATDAEGVTLFKEVTSVIFKTFFYGGFCALISAVLLKRKV